MRDVTASRGLGFARAQRILRTSEFERTMRGGRRQHSRLCTIHHRANDLDHPRLGLAVSRRVSPHAVVRNTIKRIVRECFRQHGAALPPVDVVFVARQAAAEVSRAELRAGVLAAFEQLSACTVTGRAPPPETA